ncbi:MAG: tetratricopeptide repeat protein [Acidobacteria bacterium]|nr:tetratricopeptide repeat protein [Acidobacteriota bacterium]
MRRLCATAIMLWMAVSAGLAPAEAQATFSQRLNESEQLHRQGAYEEAEKRLLALLAETEGAAARDPRKLAILHNLGSVYHSMSRYLQAEQCYRRALALEEAAGDSASEFRFQSTVNLASLYIDTGQHRKAGRLGLHALAENRPMPLRHDAGFARLLATLGALEFSLGRLDGAERFELEALKLWEELKPNGVEVIEMLSNLGYLYMEMGRFAGARAAYERALAMASATLPADDPALIRVLMNAGTLHAVVNGRAEAEPYYRRALAIAQEKLGEEHAVVGSILASYAVLLEGAGQKAQATQYRRRAESIRNALGKTDPRGQTVDLGDLQRRR